jgi:hypothetical protein
MAVIGFTVLDKVLSISGKNEEEIHSRKVYGKNQFTQPCLIECATDVRVEKFIAAVEERDPQIVCKSAPLTVTMCAITPEENVRAMLACRRTL